MENNLNEDNDNKQSLKEEQKQGTYQLLANSQLLELQENMACDNCTKNRVEQERLHAVQSFLHLMKENNGKKP